MLTFGAILKKFKLKKLNQRMSSLSLASSDTDSEEEEAEEEEAWASLKTQLCV